MHDYRSLRVWKQAMELAVKVYQLTKSFPAEERFGLTHQVRKSVVSICSNIAEGAGRNSNKEFYHFLGIANGSCAELTTQLLLAERLDYSPSESTLELVETVESIKKMSCKLQLALK